ncbi:MAG: CHAD domain-containing protein, partial [Anaerolineales bacterium]|nr:CHAD domain-containing protein [Anaerolineales bacterium]
YSRRAKLLLLWEQGVPEDEIATRVNLTTRRVRYWKQAFNKQGLNIFPGNILQSAQDQIKAREPLPTERVRQEIKLPKKRKKPGVQREDPMSEAGRKVLLFHFIRMLNHEPGTRQGDDIEELHDMRVATRRMRSAFRVFRPFFKRDLQTTYLKGLRRTGRALGGVRDLDVFMEKARNYLEKLPDNERADLDPLLQIWQQERENARRKMLTHLDGKNYQQFVQKFGVFLTSEGMGARKPRKNKPAVHRVYQAAPKLIYTRYAVLRGYDAILEGAPLETLHALRIDCKRFRYTLEFLQEALGANAKDVIEETVIVQDHLGDLNDADVACQILIGYLDQWSEEGRRERINIGGVTRYLVAKQSELRALVDTFPQTWQRFTRPEVRKALAMSVAEL